MQHVLKSSFFLLIFLFKFESAFKISLFLYTRNIRNSPVNVNENTNLLNESGFCTNCSSYLITHGFQADSNSEWIIDLKTALLSVDQNINIFVLDWSNGSVTSALEYEKAVRNINSTVRDASIILLNFAKKNYLSVQEKRLNFHCIGHSLGAHVCGLIGAIMNNNNYKFSRISGLDPAGPCFESSGPENRLSINDAYFVDIIHTSKTFGYKAQLGHADFYPNDGTSQPGCYLGDVPSINLKLDICGEEIDYQIQENLKKNFNSQSARLINTNLFSICSHGRAYIYFIESITSNCDYIGHQCGSWSIYKKNLCPKCKENRLGFYSKKPDEPTRYFVEVTSSIPHCVNKNYNLIEGDLAYCLSKSSKFFSSFMYLNFLLAFFFTFFLTNLLKQSH